jgi:plasmid stabilization system protein ParE
MKLVWKAASLRDLRRLQNFIFPANPSAARRAVQAIRQGVKIIESFPEIGRSVESFAPSVREWPINFGAGVYIVRYEIHPKEILVVAVRHGRESREA